MQNRWYRFQLGKRNMAYHNSSMRFKNFSANFVLFLTSSPATCDSISLIALWARSPRTCYRGTSFKNHVTRYGGYMSWSPFSPARCRRVAVLPSAASSAPHFVLTFLFSNGSLVLRFGWCGQSYDHLKTGQKSLDFLMASENKTIFSNFWTLFGLGIKKGTILCNIKW